MNTLIINKWRTLLLATLVLVVGVSCNEEEAPTLGTGGFQGVPDTYLQIATPVIAFQAGTEKYGISLNAIIGEIPISEVLVYSTFNDAAGATGLSSDEILLKSYAVSSDLKESIVDSLSYADLSAGITLDGSPLPESDFDIAVGAGWVLRLAAEIGGVEKNLGTINVAVLSPYAGLYESIETDYWRIGVQSGGADWSGSERFIGSVDATTFSYNDFWGPFVATGGAFLFSLDEETNILTVIDDPSQLFFSGDDMLTCQEDDGSFVNVPCDGSNVLIPDLVTGKHQIKLTYGYFTASGDENEGAREFYEVLEKVVD
jgi:hypothetical protein